MNNYRKPFKDLFQVNLEAGFLRIFLAAFLIFILWSLLAVISAIFNPLGKINFASFLGLNSQNLAFSLFLDILQSYFSIFTISFLVIFLSVFYLGYETIAGFSFLIKSFPSKKFSKDYLSFCAFSFPKPKKLLIPDDLTNNFIDFPVGPLKTAIKPGYALLIRSRANYSAKFNDEGNSDDFEVFLTHNEEVIDCFNLNPGSITLYAENKTSMKSFLIELTYSFDLPNRHEEMAKFSNMLTMFEGRKILEIIEDFLISETRISINQYFGGFNGSSFISTAHPSEKSLNANENKSKAIEQKST